MKRSTTFFLLLFSFLFVVISCSDDDIEKPTDDGAPFYEVLSIEMDKLEIELNIGDTEQLSITFTPSNASDTTLVWSSDDTSTVEVDEEGTLTAISPGRAIITATTTNNKTTSCTVNVLIPQPTGAWSGRSELPDGIGRYDAATFTIGTKFYVATGSDYTSSYDTGIIITTGEAFKNDFWMYDTTLDSWTQLNDFPGIPRSSGVGFSMNGKGYVGLGRSAFDDQNAMLKDFWEYDPNGDVWTQIDDFPGEARYDATGFASNGVAYVGLGNTNNLYNGPHTPNRDMWKYEASSSSWIQISDFSGEKRSMAIGFGIGNNIYVGMGGIIIPSRGNSQAYDWWQYDPSTSIWTQKTDLKEGVQAYDNDNYGRQSAVGFSMGGKGYVGMGHVTSYFPSQRNDFWEYDPVDDYWRPINDVPYRAESGLAFSTGNRAFLGGGFYFNICGHHCIEETAITYMFEYIP